MTSLPVFATIATTYRFLFREFATVVRLAWFPLLVMAVVQYFAAETSLEALAAGEGGDGPAMASPYDLVELIVQVVVLAIVSVSLHRLILFGDRKPGQYIAFAFGRAEARFVLLELVVFAGYFVVGLVWALALAEQPVGVSGLSFHPVVMMVLVGAALIYLLTRAAPVYPIVVAENRLDAVRGWELTHGNFWRLLTVFALGMLPLVLVIALAEGGFWALVSRNSAAPDLSTEQVIEITRGLLVYQVAIFYAAAIAASGITAALLCFSYMALRGLPPDSLLTPEYQVRP